MSSIYDKMQNIPRWIIFVIVIIAMIYPIMNPIGLPITVGQTTKDAYKAVNETEDGTFVVFNVRYGAGGKPTLQPRRGSLTDLFVAQTIAGLTVLNHIARLCARNSVKLWVPMANALVIPVARENVRDAYAMEGKLDEFDPVEMLPFVSGSQFAWASGVIGYYAREKPAANIMVGPFWAESMMLAESAARIGAVQIGGTARLYQIPFFAAVCDYVLIGEEMFAANAYLTQDIEVITSLATTDVFRLAGWATIIVGAILSTAGIKVIHSLLGF